MKLGMGGRSSLWSKQEKWYRTWKWLDRKEDNCDGGGGGVTGTRVKASSRI